MTDEIAWGSLLLRGVRIAVLVYAVFALGAWLLADRLMFQPGPPGYRDAPGLLRIPVDRDTIAALWLPNPAASHTVFFSHGNAEDLGDDLPYLEALREAGFSVFAYDYRGYGQSTGRPGERRAYRDAAAAFAHLTRTLRVPPGRVIVHGRSLGGGPSAELAMRQPVAGLVLESTFTSVFAVSPGVRIFPFDRFRVEARLKRVRAPVLVIHGTEDEVVSFRHGERLYEVARGPRRRLWVEGAGHNDLVIVAGERYWTALREFAGSLEPAPSRGT